MQAAEAAEYCSAMASSVNAALVFMMILGYTGSLIVDLGYAQSGLNPRFYTSTCPNVVQIVATVVSRHLKKDAGMGAPLVRMFFHDCFVEGCDASVLLMSPNRTAERDAVPNLTLSQFDVIDEIKSGLERACPGVVSCADILALAARDAVLQSGGPSWDVELGRRDGLKSSDFDAATHLPSSLSNAQTLITTFASNGLSIRDVVALSGAHTFGKAHCSIISRRLYGFNNSGGFDPALNATYALSLIKQCPLPIDKNAKVPLDPLTPNRFDNTYYQDVLQAQGIFSSDSTLGLDPRTRLFVTKYANDEGSFRDDFADAMIKMGRIGVLTGSRGEIRKRCASVNSS